MMPVRRLYEPMPESLREVPISERRRITRAVRRGEAMERRRDARLAIDAAEWMISQLETSYWQLITAPICLASIVILAVLGATNDGLAGAVANVVPFLAVLYLLRVGSWWLFRRAPDARRANEERLRKRKRR